MCCMEDTRIGAFGILRWDGLASLCVMAKAFDKSCLLFAINSALKEVPLDPVAEKWNSEQRVPMPCVTDADRKDILNKFGEYVGQAIAQGFSDAKVFERVQELEKN